MYFIIERYTDESQDAGFPARMNIVLVSSYNTKEEAMEHAKLCYEDKMYQPTVHPGGADNAVDMMDGKCFIIIEGDQFELTPQWTMSSLEFKKLNFDED